MITIARLSFKLQRFEILATVLIVGFLTVSGVAVRSMLDNVGVPGSCWALWFGGGVEAGSRCEILATEFLNIDGDAASRILAASGLVPFAAGVFLGVPIVAREIEEGTASNTWALARSRSRWLIARLASPLAVLVIGLGALAIATDLLWAGRNPWASLPTFDDAGSHGSPVVAKGVAAFGLGLLAGSLLGRTLPAIIVATAMCLALYLGDQAAFTTWLDVEAKTHAIAVDPALPVAADKLYPGGTHFSTGWLAPDGTFLSEADVTKSAPTGLDPREWASAHFRPAISGVPGSAYATWAAAEAAGLVVVAFVGVAFAFPVVARRRPT